MRKIILFIIIAINFTAYSQKKEKIQYYSFSFSPIGIYNVRNTTVAAFSTSITFKKNNNFFKLFLLGADEIFDIKFGDSKKESDGEYTLMYGKRVIDKKIKFDFYAGAGYYKHYVSIPEKIPGSCSGTWISSNCDYKYIDYSQNTIGFVLQAKTNYIFKNNFSLGLQLQTNINSINTIFSMGIILEWVKRHKNK